MMNFIKFNFGFLVDLLLTIAAKETISKDQLWRGDGISLWSMDRTSLKHYLGQGFISVLTDVVFAIPQRIRQKLHLLS